MNSIMMLTPRLENGQWVFDDAAVGLIREPFVGDANTLIDRMTARMAVMDRGFNLLFSEGPFPIATITLDLVETDPTGSVYKCEQHPDLRVWLCPALFRYFPKAPPRIWATAQEISKSVKPEASDEERPLRIFYRCPECGHRWDDHWTSAVDSDCPSCDVKDVEALFWLNASSPEAELEDAVSQLYAKWDKTHPVE